MIYLFIGNDEISKQGKIRILKKQLLNPQTESFNCETLQAKDLTLPLLKESLARLPVSSKNRLLVIKGISALRENIREFFLDQIKNLPEYLILVLDASLVTKGDSFIAKISKIARLATFKTEDRKDVFALARVIENKQTEYALNILADLFRSGEKPEKIFGGLRYHFTRAPLSAQDRCKIIELLLDADIKIKTGRLRPEFALEGLVVKLCT